MAQAVPPATRDCFTASQRREALRRVGKTIAAVHAERDRGERPALRSKYTQSKGPAVPVQVQRASGRMLDSDSRDVKAFIPIVIGAGALLAGSAAGPIVFEEIAERSGLTFVSDSCPTPNKNQPETMVAGVALFDYDNDGYPDVYLVNGAAIPSLRKESPKYWNRLYHNNHDGTFTDVTEKAGVAGEGYGMGVAIGDYDNDGWPDIYVVNTGKNQLFHNNRNGTFTDVTDKAGVGGGMLDGKKMWSVSAAWVEIGRAHV